MNRVSLCEKRLSHRKDDKMSMFPETPFSANITLKTKSVFMMTENTIVWNLATDVLSFPNSVGSGPCLTVEYAVPGR